VNLAFPHSCSIGDLVDLAVECDNLIFDSSDDKQKPKLKHHDFVDELVKCCKESNKPAAFTASILLALNGLESEIRHSAGYRSGRAPLLKTMISRIPNADIGRVCEILLLPKGLNLRNLVWHGFVSQIPRPWLALVLVLNILLNQVKGFHAPRLFNPSLVMDLRSQSEFQTVFDYKLDLRQASSSIQSWLPESHAELWQLAVSWYEERRRPVSTIALLSILLEHGIRLEWCKCNDRPADAIAQPSSFYVTLDGHGQRYIHNLLLHPFLMNDVEKNKLIDNYPGSTISLLTDLFCSSSGGPNIRSTVSHGSWDTFLISEWTKENYCHKKTSLLWDNAEAILVAMEWTASKLPTLYSPVFSYTAVTRRELSLAQKAIQDLKQIQSHEYNSILLESARAEFGELPDEVLSLQIAIEIETVLLDPKRGLWSTQDVYREHDLNKRLANSGASHTLLQDVRAATTIHIEHLQEAVDYLTNTDREKNKRKRKRSLRVIYSSRIAIILYEFVMGIAVLSLRQNLEDDFQYLEPQNMLKAVERSRMVTSTVESFLHSNLERALKSIKDYTNGKVIKDATIAMQSKGLYTR
jgi:hypothetical protein